MGIVKKFSHFSFDVSIINHRSVCLVNYVEIEIIVLVTFMVPKVLDVMRNTIMILVVSSTKVMIIAIRLVMKPINYSIVIISIVTVMIIVKTLVIVNYLINLVVSITFEPLTIVIVFNLVNKQIYSQVMILANENDNFTTMMEVN